MGGGACATWKVVHDPHPISSAKRGQSLGRVDLHICFHKGSSWNPTLRAMIFRRLCAPKKNNDAMHRFIFFGAQIHSESHGPMRSFKVYRVLVRTLLMARRKCERRSCLKAGMGHESEHRMRVEGARQTSLPMAPDIGADLRPAEHRWGRVSQPAIRPAARSRTGLISTRIPRLRDPPVEVAIQYVDLRLRSNFNDHINGSLEAGGTRTDGAGTADVGGGEGCQSFCSFFWLFLVSEATRWRGKLETFGGR